MPKCDVVDLSHKAEVNSSTHITTGVMSYRTYFQGLEINRCACKLARISVYQKEKKKVDILLGYTRCGQDGLRPKVC